MQGTRLVHVVTIVPRYLAIVFIIIVKSWQESGKGEEARGSIKKEESSKKVMLSSLSSSTSSSSKSNSKQ
jgi:hypothetical protein